MLRRLIRHPRTQGMLAALLAGYMALVYRTTRWTLLGHEHLLAAMLTPAGQPQGAIFACWHERIGIMPAMLRLVRQEAAAGRLPGFTERQVFALASGHRDGRLLAGVINRLGFHTVSGSTRRGGAAGALGLTRRLRQGHVVVLTPDGPRGPRRRAAPGVGLLAAMSGLALLPCAARTSRVLAFNSWDRFLLPLPFARGVVVVGAPLFLARDAAETALPGIEAALTAACATADAWVAGR